MSGEHLPPPSSLEAHVLGDRNLREWHRWLVTDEDTGADLSDEIVPASRYGRTSGEAAWWAVSGGFIFATVNGDTDEMRDVMVHMMSLAVNDHADLYDLVHEWLYMLPAPLTVELDMEPFK